MCRRCSYRQRLEQLTAESEALRIKSRKEYTRMQTEYERRLAIAEMAAPIRPHGLPFGLATEEARARMDGWVSGWVDWATLAL